MDFSNSNFSYSPWQPQAATAPEERDAREDGTGEAIQGAVGLSVDSNHELLEWASREYKTTAKAFADLSGDLQSDAWDFSQSAQRQVNEVVKGLNAGAEDLNAAADAAEHAAKPLGYAGKALGALDAVEGGWKTYQHSDAKTLGGKVADGLLGAGSKLLAGASLPIAAADWVTGGAVSDLYHAGGKAIAGLWEAAHGNYAPAVEFNQKAAQGGYGSIAKGIVNFEHYLANVH
jgi:hypothetical protein